MLYKYPRVHKLFAADCRAGRGRSGQPGEVPGGLRGSPVRCEIENEFLFIFGREIRGFGRRKSLDIRRGVTLFRTVFLGYRNNARKFFVAKPHK